MKKLIASTAFAAMAIVGTAGAATAQSPIVANNLVGVNVSGNTITLTDTVDVGNVAIPVGVAAAICDVNVVVLGELIDQGSSCDVDGPEQRLLQQFQG